MSRESVTRLARENEALRARLAEAEETLRALRAGEVDALMVDGPDGPRVYAIESVNHSYRVLVEAMSEGAASLNERGTILYCNRRFAAMLGSPLERVMGRPIADFVTPGQRARLQAFLDQARHGVSRGELPLLGGGGEELLTHVSVSVAEDGGRPTLCVVATDLREQKRNEAIIASEALLRSVIEQAADAIVVCDERGRIIRASASAARLCGLNPLLRAFDDAFSIELSPGTTHFPDLERFRREGVAGAAIHGAVVYAVPATVRGPGGASVEVLLSATALSGQAGTVLGCIVTLVDVTDARRTEEALREANARLADTDRRKDDFLAVLSHELRNPLAPIRNSTYVLEHASPGGEQARRALAVITRQVDQLARLVEDLLDLTRVARNKIQLRRSTLELNDLARRTVDDHHTLFEQAGITVELRPAPEPLWVHGDRNRLAQVLGNILQNAAKFTGRGGRATVSLAADAGARRAVVRVADTGVGMTPEVVSHVFEPFSQAEASLDRSKGGLGLGLALVKSLVDLHGGSVSVSSAGLGKGTELVIELPLCAEEPARLGEASDSGRARRRVLVIEDNADAAESLRDVLVLEGHDVVVARDGREGIATARSVVPEVVLCDIGLPGIDGYEVARALRADEALADVVLVALSGYSLPHDLERAREAGFAVHLAKPPSIEQLRQVLHQLGPARPTPSLRRAAP